MVYVNNDNDTWNQKNLDYEIETIVYNLHLNEHTLPWNQKNLDYEIETGRHNVKRNDSYWLEIKRTSITRLKPRWLCWRSRR